MNQLEITLNLAETTTAGERASLVKAQNQQEAKELLQEMEASVAKTKNLFLMNIDLADDHHVQLLLTVDCPPHDSSEEKQCANRRPSSQIPRTIGVRTVCTSQPLSPDEIYAYVEQALRDFHFVARLAKNPLVEMLDLTPFRLPEDNAFQVQGLALQRLIDQVITAITNVPSNVELARHNWRLEHYLHLRYRQEIKHRDLASWMGYTDRHLLRLRRELVMEAAELMIHQNW
ncbi:hypothetical protein KFU94_50130 [Chloroflexi bacterium TSY]|nr:hypothetical protein [Chloroflexi bacterium TSY]